MAKRQVFIPGQWVFGTRSYWLKQGQMARWKAEGVDIDKPVKLWIDESQNMLVVEQEDDDG